MLTDQIHLSDRSGAIIAELVSKWLRAHRGWALVRRAYSEIAIASSFSLRSSVSSVLSLALGATCAASAFRALYAAWVSRPAYTVCAYVCTAWREGRETYPDPDRGSAPCSDVPRRLTGPSAGTDPEPNATLRSEPLRSSGRRWNGRLPALHDGGGMCNSGMGGLTGGPNACAALGVMKLFLQGEDIWRGCRE